MNFPYHYPSILPISYYFNAWEKEAGEKSQRAEARERKSAKEISPMDLIPLGSSPIPAIPANQIIDKKKVKISCPTQNKKKISHQTPMHKKIWKEARSSPTYIAKNHIDHLTLLHQVNFH